LNIANRFPTQHSNLRIALIGDSPEKDDVQFMTPFSGTSGRFLAALLSRAGIQKEACYQGFVYPSYCQNIEAVNWAGDEIQNGLYQLSVDMKEFKPNIVILLGNVPLKAAKDPTTHHPLKPNSFQFKNSKWRGSLFLGVEKSPFEGIKCIATYHPAYCLRDYETTPMLQFDLRKAVREAFTPLLTLPQRKLRVTLSEPELIFELRRIRNEKINVAIDIEGGIDTMSCISFATSETEAFIVAFDKASTEIWREVALTLEDSYVPKILQNALYDRFVLHYSYGIRVRGVTHDTMLKHWELYPELEKSLGVQASIYTDEPYYKFERKSGDDDTFYRYCCKDSAITLEISNKLDSFLSDNRSLEHYKLNVKLLNPILYMELRGIKYDVDGAAKRRQDLLNQLFVAQAQLNGMTGHGFSWTKGIDEIKNKAREIMWRKDGKAPLKPYVNSVARLHTLLASVSPGPAVLGEIEDLCETSLNVGSAKQFQHYLYEILKLPVQMSNVRGQEPHPTSDYEALLKLSRWCTQNKHEQGFAVCQKAIEIRALQTRQSMLAISADKDGRIRCGYNLVGSNTGRITCYESPTGSGYNLQTIPNYTNIKEAPGGVLGDRDLFLADNGYYIFQCDLSGADGWTVAAYSAMLGDSTMLDDYKAGISPFKILTLMLRGLQVSGDRQELSQQVKVIGKDDWDRFACKRVQHGGSYLEGGLTISRNILKDSEGKLYMTPKECDVLKEFFFKRYWGVRKWHDWIARRLKESSTLTMASGHKRQFFGRPEEVLTKAVAAEPQHNTTYATNLAMWRLWTDSDNRVPNLSRRTNGNNQSTSDRVTMPAMRNVVQSLRIEPLHQVHDALIGEFRKTETEWAKVKIKEYFNNTLQIAGQSIVIPFEGGYGTSWGSLEQGKI
jgi:uracil-DNA glycosylase family 4